MKGEPPAPHSELVVIAVLIVLGMLGFIGLGAASTHGPPVASAPERAR